MKIRTLVAVAAIFLSAGAANAAPDRILINGKVLTADANFTIAEAVAIEGDKITAVGTNATITKLADSATEVIDVGGQTVIPGLIDNHTHMIRAARDWWREARLDTVTSRAEALDIIRKKAAESPTGEWVLVLGGWTEDQFKDDKRGFTKAELDAAAPDNPVFAQVLFVRGYANSKALEAAGITAETKDPKGGKIVRDDAGNPTGVVQRGGAIRLVRKAIPKASGDRSIEGLKKVMADLNAVGITALLDVGGGGVNDSYYEPVKTLAGENAMTVRMFNTQWIQISKPEAVAKGMKVLESMEITDGDYFGRVGVGETLYRPAHDNMFRPPSLNDEKLAIVRQMMETIARRGIHLHVHAQLDETISAFLDIIEDINKETPIAPLRWTFAHVDRISVDSQERLKALGIAVALHSRPSIQGALLSAKYGDEAVGMPPLARIASSGLVWGIGSDTSVVAPYNPFVTLAWATTGTMLDGSKVLDGTVSRREALIAHTRSNARLLLREDKLGSIEPGKAADLVVLDRDYMSVPDEEITMIRPTMTIVGGRTVYQNK
jgi:predicted amidohydrolase YtcJ